MATPDIAILHVPDRQRENTRASARAVTLPWHRVALGAILLAVVLNSWDLARLGYGNDYYAAAVRSMMQSWHNFFFNSFDPGGLVTIDKPPLGFWFQVISAKLFGYNGISLLLPSLLAGILSVWLLYYLVGRVFGRGAGHGRRAGGRGIQPQQHHRQHPGVLHAARRLGCEPGGGARQHTLAATVRRTGGPGLQYSTTARAR